MKLMILLLISLLLATSVEAGKKKCTKCTKKFEAAKKKFNKCERKNCPSPPPASPPAPPPSLRGSVCIKDYVGTCGGAASGLECKCKWIDRMGDPCSSPPLPGDNCREICTCEPFCTDDLC